MSWWLWWARSTPNFQQELAAVEAKSGVRVGDDIVAALGTDFTIAIERPTIPVPGWVAALQVNQPALLDSAIRRLVEAVNSQLAAAGQAPRLALESQQADGRDLDGSAQHQPERVSLVDL